MFNLTSEQNILFENNTPFVEVTITDFRGSIPGVVGGRVLITADGLFAGTIGGGKIENAAIEKAKLMIMESSAPEHVVWNLQKDIGMTCGGEVSLFFNISQNTNWKIAIFGAGHVSQALTRVLLNLNCSLSVIDPRSEWLDKLPSLSKVKKIQLESPANYIAELSDDTFVILMTKGHASDLPILKEALKRNFKYLGVIGSVKKRNTIEKELKELGIKENDFICPIGEPIGNNTPNEIAISITAELLRLRGNGKNEL